MAGWKAVRAWLLSSLPLSLHRMPCERPWKAMNPASFSLLSRSWWPWERKICPSKYVTLDFGGKWGDSSARRWAWEDLEGKKTQEKIEGVKGGDVWKTGWRAPDMSHLPQMSDRGGGVPLRKIDQLFSYMYSTAPTPQPGTGGTPLVRRLPSGSPSAS